MNSMKATKGYMIWARRCQDILAGTFASELGASPEEGSAGCGYIAKEATPLRMPTERSTRSAKARIKSGESLSAGIM